MAVQTQVRKWGNSLAVRIPKAFAAAIGLEPDAPVTLSISEGKLILEPARPVYSLEELLAQVTEENLHQEIDTGISVGNEVW